MITEFFINSCILITFISIFYIFIKYKDIPLKMSYLSKVLVGVYGGLLGITLMLFSVPIIQNVMVDFRYLSILLCAIFGGVLPAIIASIIIGVFRVLYFGLTYASLVALADALIIGIGFSVLGSTKASRKIKWIHSIIYLIIVTSISMVILIEKSVVLFKLLAVYPVAMIFVAYFVFKYTQYLSKSVIIDRKYRSEATVDFLTGVNNVRQFEKDFNHFSEQAYRKGENLSFLYLDIDYFKKINDTNGHNSGDIILRELARILNNTCRSFDIISRNGGEEFSVILLDCSASQATRIAEKIRKNVEANKFYISDKVSICITVSIGVTTYPDITKNIDNVIKNADTALYEAKKAGRNKVCTYGLNKKTESLSLLCLDIDHLKKTMYTYGPSVRDILLRDLIKILSKTCRSFDIESGNEEKGVSVILLDCAASQAAAVAERIRKIVEINKFYISDKVSIYITISIGVSTYPDITDNIDNLIKNADTALYEAQRTGSNKVCIYDLNKQIISLKLV